MGFFSNQKLLVIAPHPDDEIWGCGGLIAKVKREGGKVYVLVATVGDLDMYGGDSKENVRIDEFKEVMKFFNVDDYDMPLVGDKYHLKLDSVPQKQLIDLIEKGSKVSLEKIGPTIVAIPCGFSHNQDHKALASAAFAACRPHDASIKKFQPFVITYEDVYSSWYTDKFIPNFYLDISEVLDVKCQAFSLYKSQLRSEFDLRNEDNLRRLSQLRGREVGVNAAEAFMVNRFVL